MQDNCQRCGAVFNRRAANGKFCPACQKKRAVERSDAARKKRFRRESEEKKVERIYDPLVSRYRKNTAIYTVVASPSIGDMLEWPLGARLTKIEFDHCLMAGYLPSGLRVMTVSGQLFQVIGVEMHRQRLELVE